MSETFRAGYALIRLRPGFKLVQLPRCSNCERPAPECLCGRPTRNGIKA